MTDHESTDHEIKDRQDESLPTAPPETEDPEAAQTRAAIVTGPLVIQSAATPLVGLIMLAFGLVVGYLLHPALTPAAPLPTAIPTPVAKVTAAPPAVTATPVASSSTPRPTGGSPTPNATEVAQRRGLADYLASWTRHFKGNANAPVTIIEFSDFQ